MNDTETRHIWDLATVHAIQRLYASVFVDEAMIAQAVDGIPEAIGRKLARQIVRGAEPWAVIVHEEDVTIGAVPRPDDEDDAAGWPPFTTKYVAAWRPTARPVVVRGGAADGTVLMVEDPWRGVNIATPRSPAWEATEQDVHATSNHQHYSIAGWSESDRMWIVESRR